MMNGQYSLQRHSKNSPTKELNPVESELKHLLRAFGLSIDGNDWCRRSRFKYFIGVFQVGKPGTPKSRVNGVEAVEESPKMA